MCDFCVCVGKRGTEIRALASGTRDRLVLFHSCSRTVASTCCMLAGTRRRGAAAVRGGLSGGGVTGRTCTF